MNFPFRNKILKSFLPYKKGKRNNGPWRIVFKNKPVTIPLNHNNGWSSACLAREALNWHFTYQLWRFTEPEDRNKRPGTEEIEQEINLLLENKTLLIRQ